MSRQQLEVQLPGMDAETIGARMSFELGTDVKVDEACNIYPAEKQKVIADLLSKYEARHAQYVYSANIMKQPLQECAKAVEAKFNVVTDIVAEGSPNNETPQSRLEKESKTKKEGPRLVNDWWKDVVQQEMDDLETDCAPSYRKKMIMTAMAKYFADIPVVAYGGSNTVNLAFAPKAVKDSGGGKQSKANTGGEPKDPKELKKDFTELIRVSPGPPCSLPYWGKVIDATAAATAKKDFLLPLEPLDSNNPTLYLDGSGQNPLRSDCCVAWLVKPVPKKKKEEAQSPEEIEAKEKRKEAEEEKRFKDEAANPFKKLKRELAEKEKADKAPQVTHAVEFREFEIEFADVAGNIKKHTYKRPVLIDAAGAETICNKRCFRQDCDFDAVEFQSIKKEANLKGFAMS